MISHVNKKCSERESGIYKEKKVYINMYMVDKWLMPRIRTGCPIDYGIGRVLFAGEIAGFLNPMGEGISAGIESGHHAARAIIKNFDNPEQVYADYMENTAPLHAYMKRQWSFVGRMAETFKEMII